MSGTELIPDLSVIVHGRIVKGGLVRVKEIVVGYGYLDPKICLLLDIYLLRTSLQPPSGSSASILLPSLRPPWLEKYSASCNSLFSLLSGPKSPMLSIRVCSLKILFKPYRLFIMSDLNDR